ncbi:MAG: FAD binding domain-containing protein [Acidimicrobiia bacterium]
MIPAAFDYHRASSVDEAVSLLAEHGDEAKVLAGGQSLIPMMKLRLATPAVLVDVARVGDLSYVRDAGAHVAIGSMTRTCNVESDEVLREHVPLLGFVAGKVGDPQIRHRGTIGGSLAHADPAADLPAAILALDATLVARGPGGQREIAARDFFAGLWETTLAPDELLTEIRVPKLAGAGWSYQKFTRRAIDFAIVGAVAVRNGSTAVALVNMGSTPLRATAVESALSQGASAADAAAAAADGTEPPSDLSASAEYRQHLAQVFVRRALQEAGA